MAKKARNRRSGRVARQKERLETLQHKVDTGTATEEEIEQLEELRMAAVKGESPDDATEEIEISEEEAEAIARANAAADDDEDDEADEKKAKKPRRKSPLRTYLSGVRLEMRRVTWPTRQEMVKYSFSTIAMLLLTGGAVWAIDNGIISGIIAFSGLRP